MKLVGSLDILLMALTEWSVIRVLLRRCNSMEGGSHLGIRIQLQ